MMVISARAQRSPAKACIRVIAAHAVALFLTGCALHPAPEDYSRVTSRHMARQIRCETRNAALEAVFSYLLDKRNLDNHKLDERSFQIGEEIYGAYRANKRSIASFNPDRLSGYARELVGLIYQTGVAYNYDLAMTENNNNSLTLGLANIFSAKTSTLGLSASFNLQRQNTRQFTITDTLGDLIRKTDPLYCEGDGYSYIARDENFSYPLAGKIGIYDVLWEFIGMSLFDNLGGGAVKDDRAGPSQLAEQLEFTTTLDGSATPKIVFAPLTALQVADFGGAFQATRKDYHKLTMGIFVLKSTPLAALRGGILGSISRSPFGPLASAPVKNAAEEGALAAVNQALALRLFQPRP